MGGGLAFLSKKYFNPANFSNQKKVWEAEQRAEKDAKSAKERAEQLKRERDDEELAKARGGKAGGDRAALSFMYAVPPGMADERKKDDSEDAFGLQGSDDDRKPAAEMSAPAGDTSCITQRQPGDDDAAAAFRAMLAGHQRSGGDGDQDMSQTGPSNALVGSEYDPSADQKKPSALTGDNRTQLEKAVGRRDAYNTSLTLEEQVARFPSLANAPMKPGMKADNVSVSFKPLGAEIRNVKCLKCGVWGHSKGDRECQLSGWNPFALKSDSVPTAATKAAAAAAAAAVEVAKARSSDGGKPEEEKPYSGGKRAYSSGSNRGSSTDSSSGTDSSEEERRQRRRKKKDRRKRSKKGSRSHHRSRHRNDDDEHRHSTKKKKKHTGGRRRDRERNRRRDDDYTSDDAASYASHEDQNRRKGGRSRSKRRSRHHSRDRSRSRS